MLQIKERSSCAEAKGSVRGNEVAVQWGAESRGDDAPGWGVQD